jgi:hypothetical protein
MTSVRTHDSGFVALTTVLVLSAVMLALGIGMVSREILGAQGSLGMEARDMARAYAEGCADLALLKLTREPGYGGSEGILMGDDSCDIGAVEGTGESRTVRVTGHAGEHAYELSISIDALYPQPQPDTILRTFP